MNKPRMLTATFFLAFCCGTAWAQPGPGGAMGDPPAAAAPPCGMAGTACGAQNGPGNRGPGQRRGMRGPRFDNSNTFGWRMMSPDERRAHREKMHSLANIDDCRGYLADHQTLMRERAAQKGMPAPASPPVDMCQRMQDRGFFGKPPAK